MVNAKLEAQLYIFGWMVSIHQKKYTSKIPYCDNILEIQILPAAQRLYGRNWRLQQDNDPKHTSRVAKTFIDEKRIHVMDWPSILTPLKMCVISWKIMLKNKCQDVDELKRFMVEEFLRKQSVKNINMSMKQRCELILEKNGDRISY